MNVALVNNMPDAALMDTERQFRRAVGADDDAGDVELQLYTIPGLERSEWAANEIRTRYAGVDALYQKGCDALIITGTEPVQSRLEYEPYWPYLSELLQWASRSVPTTLLSCLAAHASLLIFDNLRRQPLSPKCSGVFDGSTAAAAGALCTDLPSAVAVPHSRVNDVPEQALVAAGYDIIIGSGESGVGWSVATRQEGESLFVLCQGHLEYSTESLLREYRRDVRRFLLGRGAVAYPATPEGYMSAQGSELLSRFRAELPDGIGADPLEAYARFPYQEVSSTLINRWKDSSAMFFENWLALARVRPTSDRAQG